MGPTGRSAAKVPLTIAIFCAGAPTLVATDRLLDRLGVPKDGRLTDLRYRGDGWPGLMQAEWIDATGARQVSEGISYAEGWGRILQSDRRWRCRVCSDHTGAFADISVGDPVARAARGRHRCRPVADRRAHAARQGLRRGGDPRRRAGGRARPRDVIARAQPNLKATHGAVWGRRAAMRLLGLPAPRDRGQGLCACGSGLPLAAKLQSVAGTWKRVIRERLWRRVRIAGRCDDDAGRRFPSGRTGNLDTLRLVLAACVVVSHAWPLALGPRHGRAACGAHRPFAGRLGRGALLLPLGPSRDGQRRAAGARPPSGPRAPGGSCPASAGALARHAGAGAGERRDGRPGEAASGSCAR
jgi:hypothetical protein